MKQELDFIVIGAQKAGTTSLFEYLRRHPQLSLPASKEVPYFSHDINYAGDWLDYLRKAFPFSDPGSRWGTVTPHYMFGGVYDAARMSRGNPARSDERTVPLRIQRRLPAVRLIAMLRDPVERARSHHAMALLNGWDNRPFAQAIDELLDPETLVRSRRVIEEVTGYVVWGEYGRILRGYLDVFSREQLLILFTSDLREGPQAVLRRIFEFLGVDPDFMPENVGMAYRQSGTSRRLRWLDLNVLQAAASSTPVARTLWHATPEPVRRRVDRQFDRMNYALGLWNRREGEAAEAHEPETDVALREHYRQDAKLVTELLDVAPPWQ